MGLSQGTALKQVGDDLPRNPRRPLAGRWNVFRSRLLASDRFRVIAARFPPTRPIARRQARKLFDLCAGFVYSQVLYSCVRLRLFHQLADGPRNIRELAKSIDLEEDEVARLASAAASLKLIEVDADGQCGLGPLGAIMLGSPGITAMVEHHAMLYEDLTDPIALLRGEKQTTRLGDYWPYVADNFPAQLDEAAVKDYSALMAASQQFIAEEVLAAYPVQKHRCLLDIGGGEGAFILAAAMKAPDLKFVLFDLPPVVGLARDRLAGHRLLDRVTLVSGDFFNDPLPVGADLITLVRVIHDHDEERALALLREIRQILPQDGTLLLAEPMSGTKRAQPAGAAYFGFYLLAMGSGRPRSIEELTDLLDRAGFLVDRVLRTRTPMLVRGIVARPKRSTI